MAFICNNGLINITFLLTTTTVLLQSPLISSFTTFTPTTIRHHRPPFPPSHNKPHHHHRDNNHHHHQSLYATTSDTQSPHETLNNNDDDDYHLNKIFDFTNDIGTAAVDAFERIDDAIMGGISTSTLRDVVGQPYASWSGVCRIDGGGFCGIRTLPFTTPLSLPSSTTTTGLFLDIRLASDDEPHRRVWKFTLRTDPQSRGEQLYQAQYTLPVGKEKWQRVYVPFDSFRLVRGARLVKANDDDDDDDDQLLLTGLSAASLEKSGITQLGLSLSKFVMAETMTTLDDFRPGYFELHVKMMGFYGPAITKTIETERTMMQEEPSSPKVLSPKESQRRKPFLLQLLSPMGGFLERKSRRKRAMKLLMKRRGIMTRMDAVLWGLKMNTAAAAAGVGEGGALMKAVIRWMGLVMSDGVGLVVSKGLRFGLVYPLIAITRSVKFVKTQVLRLLTFANICLSLILYYITYFKTLSLVIYARIMANMKVDDKDKVID